MLYQAMQDRQLFACSHEDGHLVAVGGTFWVGRCEHPGGAPVGVYELAGLVVHPDVRGLRPHGIQDVLVAVRAAALALQENVATCVISSVATGNNSSRKSLARCGLIELAEAAVPQWLRDVRRTWLAGVRPDVVDYIVPPDALQRHHQILQIALGQTASTGTSGTPVYQIELAPEPVLDDVLASAGSLPSWEASVPPRRLLGSEPPFIPWPR